MKFQYKSKYKEFSFEFEPKLSWLVGYKLSDYIKRFIDWFL
jgi:hypothetical protein